MPKCLRPTESVEDLPTRWPCEKYIQFLLVGAQTRWCLSDVQRHIRHLGFPKPHDVYLIRLRDELELERPKPYLVGSQPPEEWLKQKGFWSLCYPNPVASKAVALLSEHDARTAIEALLLCGAPLNQVLEYLRELTGMDLDLDTVEHYGEFYWNRRLLNATQWREFLHVYEDGEGLYRCYLLEPTHTLYHLGVRMRDLDMRSVLIDLAQHAYFKATETRILPPLPETARMFQSYSRTAVDVYREMSGATEMGRVIEQVRAIGLKKKKKEIDKLADAVEEARILDGTTISVEPEAQGAKK